jgi:hypothetical protein
MSSATAIAALSLGVAVLFALLEIAISADLCPAGRAGRRHQGLPKGADTMTTQRPIRLHNAYPAWEFKSDRTGETRPLHLGVEVAGEPVAPSDLAYAWEQMRDLSRLSPRTVQWGRTRLSAARVGRARTAADAILLLDGDLVMCAGSVAPTTREAIDQLAGRLRRRINALRERDDGYPGSSLRPHEARDVASPHGTEQCQRSAVGSQAGQAMGNSWASSEILLRSSRAPIQSRVVVGAEDLVKQCR